MYSLALLYQPLLCGLQPCRVPHFAAQAVPLK